MIAIEIECEVIIRTNEFTNQFKNEDNLTTDFDSTFKDNKKNSILTNYITCIKELIIIHIRMNK